MHKSGKAKILQLGEINKLFHEIRKHRHPEKNAAIMQISIKLGLRVQEIALLQLKEVCRPLRHGQFKLRETMKLPAAITKGADAMNRSKTKYERKTVTFKVREFNKTIDQVVKLTKAGVTVKAEEFYPEIKKHKGRSRDLPMVDQELRDALSEYLLVRLSKTDKPDPTAPLFLTQKGCAYSPNTLQEHMAMMMREWAGIEDASSHSGRRTLMTDIIHKQKKPLKIAQQIAGHVNASTTIIYTEATTEEIEETLKNVHATIQTKQGD